MVACNLIIATCTFKRSGDLLFNNIYTSSVFCYDKHKKNFDIQFSMKRHDGVTTNNDARRIMTGCFV